MLMSFDCVKGAEHPSKDGKRVYTDLIDVSTGSALNVGSDAPLPIPAGVQPVAMNVSFGQYNGRMTITVLDVKVTKK